MESRATISALIDSASPTASAVFPEPVGPAKIRQSRKVAGSAGMPGVRRRRAVGSMAVFEWETVVAAPPDVVFDFIARPANLPKVSPPAPRFELLEAPERLTEGVRFTVRVRKYGVWRRLQCVVTWFGEG